MSPPTLVNRHQTDKPPLILPRGPTDHPPESLSALLPRSRKPERGRKNVSRACQVCRQRRIRCTSERPCRPCQVNGLDCVDDGGSEAVDLRTIRLAPQNQKAFVQHKTLLDRLLRSIRANTGDDVLRCIKEGGTMAQIAHALDEVEESPAQEDDDGSTPSDDQSTKQEAFDHNSRDVSYLLAQHLDTDGVALSNFGNLPLSSALRANGFPPHIQEQQIQHLSQSAWESAPLTSDDASLHDAFSRSCLSFRNHAREQLNNGASPELILSLNGIEMDLLFRNRAPSDPHTISTWACELLKTFGCLSPVVKLAAAEAVACLMRWLIAPLKEYYLLLPPASKPTPSQFFVPHSIGIDVMMLPQIRDALLTRHGAQAWTNIVSSSTMDFHWPYSIDACVEVVVESSSGTRSYKRLSRAFVEHIRDPTNLTLDHEVLNAFPEFKDMFRWHASSLHTDVTMMGDGDDLMQSDHGPT